MNWFKRLCLFVFGVSGILALAALSLTWVGPWTTQARSMLEFQWYFITLEVLVCLSGAGLLICVLVSLFAPRNPKETIVAKVPGGEITVTRAAIVSQAKHVIEADGSCIASSVRVRMRKRGHVRVSARVTPRRPVDLIERGTSLYEELGEGLSHICGDCVKSVDVVFNEPEQQGPLRTYVERETPTTSDRADAGQDVSVPVSSLSTVSEPSPASEPEIPDTSEGPTAEPAQAQDLPGDIPEATDDSEKTDGEA